MNIHIYFDFVEGVKGGLAVNINKKSIGLQLAPFGKARILYYELKDYPNQSLSIEIVALAGKSSYIVYFVNEDTGAEIKQQWELPDDRKGIVKQVDLQGLYGNDYTIDHGILPKESKSRPVHKKPEKKTYKSTMSFGKDFAKEDSKMRVPDYSHYENQVPREKLLTAKADESQNTIVEVFYATDRKVKLKKKGRTTYTNTRGDLQLGSCLVSVPANKKKGEIPLPPWYLFGFSSDEDQYMLIKEVNTLSAGEFFKKISDKVHLSPEKDAFVFVHGYNVDFTQSAMRAAQITTDIGFRGAPIIYSWPSRHKVLGYNADEATATGYSTDNIIQLIKDVRMTTGAERVHLIAHSMGNRLLTEALKALVHQGFNKDFLFNQIILAAPDIDAEVFVKDIAPKIVSCSERVTLYTSQQDKPLWFSGKLHGSIQRTGSSGNFLAIIDGMDTVDASVERTDFLGHGYFAESRALIDDIFHVVRFNKSPEDRNLRKKTSEDKFYWEFF